MNQPEQEQQPEHQLVGACPNCGSALAGRFCAQCGQASISYRASIWQLSRELLGESLGVDGRLWRTLTTLFLKPGGLTQAFSEDRRMSFISPGRLYLFASLLFFFLLAVTGGLSDVEPPPDKQEDIAVSYGHKAEEPEKTTAGEPEAPDLESNSVDTSVLLNYLDAPGKAAYWSIMKNTKRSDEQATLAELTNEFFPQYNDSKQPPWLLQSAVSPFVKLLDKPEQFAREVIDNMPLAMFVLVPFYALLLKILFLGSGKFYSEHLVFTLHVHILAFLILSAAILIPEGTAGLVAILGSLAGLAAFTYLGIYTFLAMSNYYGLSRAAISWRFITLGFGYLGTAFTSVNGRRSGEVLRLLGAGGQGAVYEVRFEGALFALKWYHDYYNEIDTGLRPRLQRALERGAPDERFLWPLELVTVAASTSFGYIMPLRTANYRGMGDLIAPPPQRLELSFPARANVCEQLATCFLQLHSRGFCYQDVNFGNIFLEPETADVLICDNDNVNVDGADASIYGTRKFMAPEVVRRETLPSTKTDLFSMAVMFFYVIFGWHPLDGQREAKARILDGKTEMSLYGTDPLFLFDPDDNSNGPVSGLHDPLIARWDALGEELRSLFLQSFGVGMSQPGSRVLENQWQSAFRNARLSAYSCGHCEQSVLVTATALAASTVPPCSYCGELTNPPPVLTTGKRVLVLGDGLQLTQGELTGAGSNRAAGLVNAHPSRPGILGLKNLSSDHWQTEIPGYSATAIAPGKTVRLLDGLRLGIGRSNFQVSNPKDIQDKTPEVEQ